MIVSIQQFNSQYAWEARREDGEPKEISFMAGFANSKDTIPDSIRKRFGDGVVIHFQNVESSRCEPVRSIAQMVVEYLRCELALASSSGSNHRVSHVCSRAAHPSGGGCVLNL
jgi:hypothetical protein